MEEREDVHNGPQRRSEQPLQRARARAVRPKPEKVRRGRRVVELGGQEARVLSEVESWDDAGTVFVSARAVTSRLCLELRGQPVVKINAPGATTVGSPNGHNRVGSLVLQPHMHGSAGLS